MRRLNFGCAFDVYDEWEGFDKDDHGQEHVGSILEGLPWDDETFDVVVSHHALQIIPYMKMEYAFSELHRILKPGGYFRFTVPDVIEAFHAWARNDRAWFPVGDDVHDDIGAKLSAYLTWYSEARSAFTVGYVKFLMDPLGWDAWGFTALGHSSLNAPAEALELDKRPRESLFIEAVK